MLFVHEVLLKLGLDGLILADALQGVEVVLLRVTHEENIAELTLSKLLHSHELVKLKGFTLLCEGSAVVLLNFQGLVDGCTVADSIE